MQENQDAEKLIHSCITATLWLAVKELKEKLQNEGSDYRLLLHVLQLSSTYYDDIWRSAIFCLAGAKKTPKLLQKDQKLRDKLIEEEKKSQKIFI